MELIIAAIMGVVAGAIVLRFSYPSNKQESEYPCNPDHNGECLTCDCWLVDCAYERYLNEDYTHETKEELEELFKNTKQC